MLGNFAIWCFVLLPALNYARVDVSLATKYFKKSETSSVVIFACSFKDNLQLQRSFNSQFVTTVSFDFDKFDVDQFDHIFATDDILGLLVDVACTKNKKVLKLASDKAEFHPRRRWLVFWDENLDIEDMKKAAILLTPPLFDIDAYFIDEYEGMANRPRVEEINADINQKVLEELKNESVILEYPEAEAVNVSEEVMELLKLNIMLDSDVTIAVPQDNQADSFKMWSIHRKTNHSKMETEVLGTVRPGQELELENFKKSSTIRRNDFHGAFMRATCTFLRQDYFRRTQELTPLLVDVWSQMALLHSTLLEEMLNFRMLLKCFNDFGWPVNGTTNGAIGYLQNNKAEMCAIMVILTSNRLEIVDYVDSTFKLKLGTIFIQPPLPQVTNIFMLPFSTDVWIALVILVLITGAILYVALRLEFADIHSMHEHLGEVVSFLSGAMCQQGTDLSEMTLGLRAIMAAVLLSTIFFFTSYTATIVALLQSPSHHINNLETLIESPLRVGIEDLVYERRLLIEDKHETVIELNEKKIAPLGKEAFQEISHGVEKIRQGFYAFQCEISNAFKIIEETYTENEKCGLEILEVFPNRFVGATVPNKSPHREILTERMRWLREVGITSYIARRWLHFKSKCESKSTGFASIGIIDVAPLFHLLVYGMLISFFVLFVEVLSKKFSARLKIGFLTRGSKNEGLVVPRKVHIWEHPTLNFDLNKKLTSSREVGELNS